MKTEVSRMQITPTLATKWLESIPEFQRKIDEKQVRKLVFAITKERWQENGATIVFNEKGELIDGQHRLKAISLAGKSVGSLVVKGLSTDENVFRTIGDEKPRSVKDFLKCPSANTVASVLRIYWGVMNGVWPVGAGGGDKMLPPITEILKLGDKWTDVIGPILDAVNPAGRFLGQTSYCAFLVLYHTRLRSVENPERVAEFFARVADGLNLTATDPVYKLRQRILSVPSTGALNRVAVKAVILKSMYLYLDGKPCGHLRFDPEKEDFPALRGLRK